MLRRVVQSHLALLIIPLFALAIEPNDPTTLCDRFLGDNEKNTCVEKVSKAELDWYAASSCGQFDDDKNFQLCLDEIKGASFNPEAVELCTKENELSDNLRMSCLKRIKNRDYSVQDLKKCSSLQSADARLCVETLDNKDQRAPASHKKTTPKGFQPLEIKRSLLK